MPMLTLALPESGIACLDILPNWWSVARKMLKPHGWKLMSQPKLVPNEFTAKDVEAEKMLVGDTLA